MHQGRSAQAAHDRDFVHMIGDVRHQPLREDNTVVRGRVEFVGSPGTYFQIESVNVAWRALHVNKDAVLGLAEEARGVGLGPGLEQPARQWSEEVTSHAGAGDAEE